MLTQPSVQMTNNEIDTAPSPDAQLLFRLSTIKQTIQSQSEEALKNNWGIHLHKLSLLNLYLYLSGIFLWSLSSDPASLSLFAFVLIVGL